MQTPDPVETILARLIPAALSEQGLRDIESMIDELAPAGTSPIKPWFRRRRTAGIAATGIAAALLLPLLAPDSPISDSVSSAATRPLPGFVLVSESDTIRSMSDEGWQEDNTGSAMRALRLNIIEENSLLDEATGIVMQISEPREEVLLMPVSTF